MKKPIRLLAQVRTIVATIDNAGSVKTRTVILDPLVETPPPQQPNIGRYGAYAQPIENTIQLQLTADESRGLETGTWVGVMLQKLEPAHNK